MATAVPGTTTTYTIVVSNAGPSTATGASFADNLPAGLGTITNDDSATAGIPYRRVSASGATVMHDSATSGSVRRSQATTVSKDAALMKTPKEMAEILV